MEIHVISIFPEMFTAITEFGVVGRAVEQGIVNIHCHNPRDFTNDKHRMVDDRPYGGGPGMIMMAEPLLAAIDHAKQQVSAKCCKVVYLSPQGQQFTHDIAIAHAFASDAEASDQALILIAGRYEGIDERVIQSRVDEQWSIGDYVLSGGELPIMVVIDAISRLLPGSLGNKASAEQDSFVNGLLDSGHYTRPDSMQIDGVDCAVPEVLLNGDHKAIADWRLKQALGQTWLHRPDLLKELELTAEQEKLLATFKQEHK